jgi:2-polyprenyl-3-methyl-5-hydroxy-6-metoxy-1,4-benzoquinol methylase
LALPTCSVARANDKSGLSTRPGKCWRVTVKISAGYTLDNHRAQSSDAYALAKTEIIRAMLTTYAKRGMTLLNIGCGAGYFSNVVAARGLRVIGCEPERLAFEMARKDAPQGCTVYNCDLAGLSKQGVSGDLAVMVDVFEHIEDDAEAAAHLRSMLRPGAHAIISVPALPWLYGVHDERLGHFRRYSARSFRNLLETQFEICSMRYFGALSIPIVVIFSQLLRREYPRKAGREGVIGRLYSALCVLETGVRFPIGTSLIADVRTKP